MSECCDLSGEKTSRNMSKVVKLSEIWPEMKQRVCMSIGVLYLAIATRDVLI